MTECVEFRPRRPKTRFNRCCPECREVIPAGTQYVCYGGVFDGDLFSGTMCSECYSFLDLYMQFLRGLGFEAEYAQGDIINAATEHVNFHINTPDLTDYSLADRRDLMAAFFKIIKRRRRLAKAA